MISSHGFQQVSNVMDGLKMDANIAIAQARGLRRVAADLDRVWDDYLKGDRTPADDLDA